MGDRKDARAGHRKLGNILWTQSEDQPVATKTSRTARFHRRAMQLGNIGAFDMLEKKDDALGCGENATRCGPTAAASKTWGNVFRLGTYLVSDGLLLVVLHLTQQPVLLVLRCSLLIDIRHFQTLSRSRWFVEFSGGSRWHVDVLRKYLRAIDAGRKSKCGLSTGCADCLNLEQASPAYSSMKLTPLRVYLATKPTTKYRSYLLEGLELLTLLTNSLNLAIRERQRQRQGQGKSSFDFHMRMIRATPKRRSRVNVQGTTVPRILHAKRTSTSCRVLAALRFCSSSAML